MTEDRMNQKRACNTPAQRRFRAPFGSHRSLELIATAALLTGCASSGIGSQAAHQPARNAAHIPARHTAAKMNPAAAANRSPVSSANYAVEISSEPKTIRAVSTADEATILVRNTGSDIPDLSLCFPGAERDYTVREIWSDRAAEPAGVRVDTGRGWDFGPLPHGATTRITLRLASSRPGKRTLLVKSFAVAEDEGDELRSVDSHIQGADRKLSIWVQSTPTENGA